LAARPAQAAILQAGNAKLAAGAAACSHIFQQGRPAEAEHLHKQVLKCPMGNDPTPKPETLTLPQALERAARFSQQGRLADA